MVSDEMLAAQAALGDLTQETFIRAYRGIGQFRHTSTFRTWLHRIALNVIWSYRARRRQRPSALPVVDRDGDSRAPEIATSADDPETALIRRQAIGRALAACRPRRARW